jgi:arylsulfatase A-like enzyme
MTGLCSPVDERSRGANVLLVSIDTLRADHLSVYGYERPTSPNLERLAGEAVVFERFFQNGGWTLPSHMTLMTSLHPRVHDVRPRNGRVLPAERRTLAEVLTDAGYLSAGFADAGWLKGEFGFEQGFQVYDDEGGRFQAILPRARAWLRDHHRERFFLFLHTYDVHSQPEKLPYSCPGEDLHRFTADMDVDFDGCVDGRCATNYLKWVLGQVVENGVDLADLIAPERMAYLVALYDGCIRYVDARLGELFGLLRELGVYDDTLIVVLSDHGEEFGEHGAIMHRVWGHEETARVPLLMKLPGGRLGGTRVRGMGALVDVMPTILDVVGLEPPAEAEGMSLMPLATGTGAGRDRIDLDTSLRTERWKWVTQGRRLYDLRRDPGEQHNVRRQRRKVADALSRELRARQLRHEATRRALEARDRGEPPVALEADEREALRALGYLD